MSTHSSSYPSPIAAFVRWCQRWSGSNSAELRNWDRETVAGLAREVGVSADEFRQLARKDEHAADLLLPRMAALDLDPKEVSKIEPKVMQDMQRVCSMCQAHGRCLRDLKADAGDPVWKEYCPNVDTLMALDKQPWGTRREV